jgi:hypothetical protein
MKTPIDLESNHVNQEQIKLLELNSEILEKNRNECICTITKLKDGLSMIFFKVYLILSAIF